MIERSYAKKLENIIQPVYTHLTSNSLGGCHSIGFLQECPFNAALLATAPFYYKGICVQEIDDFLNIYANMFCISPPQQFEDKDIETYIDELEKLVSQCVNTKDTRDNH